MTFEFRPWVCDRPWWERIPRPKGARPCLDCKARFPAGYMLKTPVWKQVCGGDGTRIVLCFACAQKRLGRTITYDDLTSCPLNDALLLGVAVEMQTHGPGAVAMYDAAMRLTDPTYSALALGGLV